MPAEPEPHQNQPPAPSEKPERPQEHATGLKEGSVVTEASDNSFPASDPPAWTTTAGAGAPADEEPPKERTQP